MNSLYVIEPGSFMKIRGETLRIEKDGTLIQEIPAAHLKRLTLAGRCSMTGAVLDFLIERRIETVFMTLSGRFRARLLLDAPGHVRLRQLQYNKLSDPKFCKSTASIIVRNKIGNQRALLMKRGGGKRNSRIAKLCVQLKALEKRAGIPGELNELRGIEGIASRTFYQGYATLIKNPSFSFTGRNRRPPKDPVNALLSFVYTLFTNEVSNAIKASGLDPYLGALHEPASGRPSLACDMVEEWRALAESFVLTIINKRMVVPEDFIKTGGEDRPVTMAPPFVRALIKAYEKLMDRQISWDGNLLAIRWAIHNRVRDFIDYLRHPEKGWAKRRLPL